MQTINNIGRRKTAVARIYLTPGTGNIIINGKDYKEYFPTLFLQYSVELPFKLTNTWGQYDVKANIDGGGTTGQADAIKLAIARSLDEVNEEMHGLLKPKGLFTRDSRMVERKKPGQRKARRKFQFSKR